MPPVNWIAVFGAAVSMFVLGGLWYSPVLFGKAWQRLAGVTDEQMKTSNMAVIFGGAFALSLLAAWMFGVFLGEQTPLVGAGYGLSAGVCWVAAAFGINYLFERRPLGLFAINSGYNAVAFTLVGLILGLG